MVNICKQPVGNRDVYFDDLKITHRLGALLEETHYFAKTTNIEVGVQDIYTPLGGHPSGIPGEPSGDIQEHQRAYKDGKALNGVRSIVVDEKNIYLYNSSPNQIIVVPRPR
jgi:hypothetical protein